MAEKSAYPVYDHDTDGHASPDVDHGRVYFDDGAGKLMCSVHGDTVASDGSLVRKVTEAQVATGEDGLPFLDQSNQKEVGDARLFRCTVCGQGTWSHLS